MNGAVEERMREFARSLLERHGALVDWPEGREGLAVLPREVARLLRVREEVRLSSEATPEEGALSVNLATDFMEHNLDKLNILHQRGRGSFATRESLIQELLLE